MSFIHSLIQQILTISWNQRYVLETTGRFCGKFRLKSQRLDALKIYVSDVQCQSRLCSTQPCRDPGSGALGLLSCQTGREAGDLHVGFSRRITSPASHKATPALWVWGAPMPTQLKERWSGSNLPRIFFGFMWGREGHPGWGDQVHGCGQGVTESVVE